MGAHRAESAHGAPLWRLACVSAGCLSVLLAAGGFGASVGGRTAGASDAPPHAVRAVARTDGLSVVVTATGSGTTTVVRFAVEAADAHARGALGYDVAFGDGTSTSDEIPQFCTSGSGVSRHELWHLAHRYAVGTYRVTVTVRSNCSRVAATARLTVRHA